MPGPTRASGGTPDDVLGSPGVLRTTLTGQAVEDSLFGVQVQVTGRAANATIGAAFAIASYERTLVADQTPWDAFVSGNPGALTPNQAAGWADFRAIRCDQCHAPPTFTDHSYRNIGIRPPGEDTGRQVVTGLAGDRGKFKTPTLRNVAPKTAFMHNGRLGTLPQAVAWYRGNNPQRFPDNLDPLLPLNNNPGIDARITDFLTNGLTDPRVAAESFPFDRPTLHAGDLAILDFADRSTMSWIALAGVQSYNVYRGELAGLTDTDADGLPDGGYGSCISDLDPDSTDTTFADTEVPKTGGGFFYLRSAVDGQAAERGLGATSSGRAREILAVCP